MSLDAPPPKLGLRERKKQQTRQNIARVALQLFAERGYDETTLADIAEAADVSPRTIFAYYDSKEEIVLCEDAVFLDALRQKLEERPEGTTTIDALREFLGSIEPPDDEARLRKKVVMATPTLQMGLGARYTTLEPLLAESIARDLHTEPDDVRSLLIAASMTAAFMSVRDRAFDPESGGASLSHEQGMAILDQVLEFTRGGLEALQQK